MRTTTAYKLVASDLHSRNRQYERLYYPLTGEWVHGEIYVALDPSGIGIEKCLNGSYEARYLLTLEVVIDDGELLGDGVMIVNAVRVIDCHVHRPPRIHVPPSEWYRNPHVAFQTFVTDIAYADFNSHIDIIPGDVRPYFFTYTYQQCVGFHDIGMKNKTMRVQSVKVGLEWLLSYGLDPNNLFY